MAAVRYFAYGSNMQSHTLRTRRSIMPVRAVAARATGWQLVLDKPGLLNAAEGMANIVAAPGHDVYGVLYEIAPEDLDHLELTEGVRIGNYARVKIEVALLNSDDDLPAWTFVSEHRAEVAPSQRYMSLLIEGALEHGLPAHYVDWLRSIAAKPEDEASRQWRPVLDHAMRRR